MTEKEIKQAQAEYKRFLITALNVLWLNNKITEKEYTIVRNRILENKEVTKWLMQKNWT